LRVISGAVSDRRTTPLEEDLLDATSAADAIAEAQAQARRRRERGAWAASSQAAPPTEPTAAIGAALSRTGWSVNAGR